MRVLQRIIFYTVLCVLIFSVALTIGCEDLYVTETATLVEKTITENDYLVMFVKDDKVAKFTVRDAGTYLSLEIGKTYTFKRYKNTYLLKNNIWDIQEEEDI